LIRGAKLGRKHITKRIVLGRNYYSLNRRYAEAQEYFRINSRNADAADQAEKCWFSFSGKLFNQN
jgi:hypothetical protein